MAGSGLPGAKVWGSSSYQEYEGKLLVTLQLEGGVDVTQLCDPKVNVQGEPKINLWADQDEPQQIGNILYAPVAQNTAFVATLLPTTHRRGSKCGAFIPCPVIPRMVSKTR